MYGARNAEGVLPVTSFTASNPCLTAAAASALGMRCVRFSWSYPWMPSSKRSRHPISSFRASAVRPSQKKAAGMPMLSSMSA